MLLLYLTILGTSKQVGGYLRFAQTLVVNSNSALLTHANCPSTDSMGTLKHDMATGEVSATIEMLSLFGWQDAQYLATKQ